MRERNQLHWARILFPLERHQVMTTITRLRRIAKIHRYVQKRKYIANVNSYPQCSFELAKINGWKLNRSVTIGGEWFCRCYSLLHLQTSWTVYYQRYLQFADRMSERLYYRRYISYRTSRSILCNWLQYSMAYFIVGLGVDCGWPHRNSWIENLIMKVAQFQTLSRTTSTEEGQYGGEWIEAVKLVSRWRMLPEEKRRELEILMSTTVKSSLFPVLYAQYRTINRSCDMFNDVLSTIRFHRSKKQRQAQD